MVFFEVFILFQFYSMSINNQDFKFGDDFLILVGLVINVKIKGVFVGYGWVDVEIEYDDYVGLDVKGKVVFVLFGFFGVKDFGSIMGVMCIKCQLVEECGVVVFVEFYQLFFFWVMFVNFFGNELLCLVDEDSQFSIIIYVWMNKVDGMLFIDIQLVKKLKVQLNLSGFN